MPVTSVTDICNLALDLLSGATVTNVVIPTTADESLCQRWYDHCRKKVLREHPWRFATKRIVLAADAIDPVFGYAKAFSVPNDFIRLVSVETSDGIHLTQDSYQFELNKVLMVSEADAVRLVYVYNNEDVSSFDPMFISYLALDIALSMAFKITESNTNIEKIKILKEDQGAMARAISGQERPPVKIQRSRNRDLRLSNSSANAHRIIF